MHACTTAGCTANALARETSPYLRQHAHNPVAWLPWGDAALLRDTRHVLQAAGAELNKAPTNFYALLCVLDDLREHAHDHA
jgi:hypothetical protein